MIDRVMLNGVVYAVTVANNPLPDDKVITVDGVQYIVGEPIVEAISEGGGVVGSIDKVVVNGNIYDIQDVEDVARETERAKQAESNLSNAIADLKRNAMHYDTLGVNVYPDKAEIYGRSINTTPREVVFPAATHEKAGVMSAGDKEKLDSLSEGVGVAELMREITYSELVALRDNADLVAGMKYRITDYVTTTVQKNTKSANHPFDLIVEAVSENELSELAQAIQHDGDTYFDGNDLGAWQLWYSLDNDTNKYTWADAENGRGVIYRMIDEKRNDCPYDFKNILFYTTNYTDNTTSDKYYYTFSYVVSGVLYDGTVEKRVTSCHNNSMGVYTSSGKNKLNGNIFRNASFGDTCSSNTFGNNCYSNSFGYECYSNTFGNYCSSNSFGGGCRSNKFGNDCCSNKFGVDCYYNTFLDNCNSNSFGDYCYSNTFGYDCGSNTFGDHCYLNTFGDYCYSNTFEGICYSNKFEEICNSNTFGYDCGSNTFGDHCYLNTFGNNTSDRKLDSDHTSITLNEEYYDDGNNALVPIKHPDLSTQPSILPYKFMGQYVYEQLIPNIKGGEFSDAIQNIFAVKKPLIISADSIGGNASMDATPDWWIEENTFNIRTSGVSNSRNVEFFRIVYTSMPEEGDYYGYNNY